MEIIKNKIYTWPLNNCRLMSAHLCKSINYSEYYKFPFFIITTRYWSADRPALDSGVFVVRMSGLTSSIIKKYVFPPRGLSRTALGFLAEKMYHLNQQCPWKSIYLTLSGPQLGYGEGVFGKDSLAEKIKYFKPTLGGAPSTLLVHVRARVQ